MATQGTCILLVNEDLMCCNIVADILKNCTYEVMHVGKPLETLSSICVRKDEISLVLTNLHRIQAQATSDILHHIQNNLKLPTFLMSPDAEKIELKCQENSFAAYLLSSLNGSNISSVWELASMNAMKVTKATDIHAAGSAQMASSSRNLLISGENTPSSYGNHHPREHQKKQKKREKRERSEIRNVFRGADGRCLEKKHRVIWTAELHMKFLQAIELILPEKPVPKKIVELMNIPWLRREHVASHLQKYRIMLRKIEERATALKSGMILKDPSGQPRLPSYHSSRRGNSLPYEIGMAHFHEGTLGLNSTAGPSNHPISVNARASSRILNLWTSRVQLSNNEGSPQQLLNPNLASQNNNYLPLGNSQGNDHTGLEQMQLNLGPGNLVMTSGFRSTYGDQEGSMLLGDPGSKTMSDSTVTESTSVGIFMGFRLTNGGKSIEFGQPSAPGRIEIRRELSISEISGSENQSLDRLLPAVFTNKTQVPPSAMQQNVSSQNHNSEINYPFLGGMSLLVKSAEYTVLVDPCSTIQHHPLPQHSSITVNEESLRGPSRLVNNILPPQQQDFLPQYELGTPASWEFSAQSAPLPTTSGEQQPSLLPSNPPRYDHIPQYHAALLNGFLDGQMQFPVPPQSGDNIVAHSFIMPASQQESLNVPVAENPGHDASSIQEPPASFQNLLNQEPSTPSVSEQPNCPWLDESFSHLLNETPSVPAIWDGGFDETYFNQNN